MRAKTIYICETCGFQSFDANEMEQHEANHLGLTVEEFHSYNTLKSFAAYMGGVVCNRNNDETRGKFDEAIAKLVAFEEEHHIKVSNMG